MNAIDFAGAPKVGMWHYMTIFEVVAPLKNRLMFHQADLKKDMVEWAKLSKAFTDCKVKQTADQNAQHVGKTVAEIKALLEQGNTSHHNYLQYFMNSSSG